MKSQNILNNPSIHDIIIEDKSAKLNHQIRQFFKTETYPTFPINDLIAMPNYTADHRFYALIRELQDWNKKVDENAISRDMRTQLYRNKFVHSSLRSILINSSKGSQNYETNLTKLYEWFRKNSQEQMPIFLTARKRNKQDEDWQVRKTFKSNMPLQLRNYERRALFTTQQELNYLQCNKNRQLTNEKLVDYSAIKQYKYKQLKQRQVRQQKQIHASKTLLKYKKCRFQEDAARHFQYFQGKFNQTQKTGTFFGQNADSSLMGLKNRNKHFASLSIIEKQKNCFHQIKKYRLNSVLGKKAQENILFQQKSMNLNKTAKSFMTSKNFQATVSDLGETFFNRDQKSLKQPTIKMQLLKNNSMTIDAAQTKQNSPQFNEFDELKNWQGERLLSNPFQKKKQLKKKKNK